MLNVYGLRKPTPVGIPGYLSTLRARSHGPSLSRSSMPLKSAKARRWEVELREMAPGLSIPPSHVADVRR